MPVLSYVGIPESTALKFITKVSFTAQTNVSVDYCFSAKYSHYLITRNFTTATGSDMPIRLRINGVDDAGTFYRYQYIWANGTGATAGRATAQTNWYGAISPGDTAWGGFTGLIISNPYQLMRTTALTNAGFSISGNISLVQWIWTHDNVASYDGFSIVPGYALTGSVSIYGFEE